MATQYLPRQLCTHEGKSDVTAIGAVAAEVMARAVNRAVLKATGIPGYPAHRDITKR